MISASSLLAAGLTTNLSFILQKNVFVLASIYMLQQTQVGKPTLHPPSVDSFGLGDKGRARGEQTSDFESC